jgi:hypothetical protein
MKSIKPLSFIEMDASDTIRKRKSQVYYINQNAAFTSNNPGGDCATQKCCYNTSSCVRTFDSYELKYTYFEGLNNCYPSSYVFPVNGGSK